MKTPEEIAKWVIDSRYSKSEKQKVSDQEMYLTLVSEIKEQAKKEYNKGFKDAMIKYREV